jgi:phage terminase large subunit-like protein
MAKWDLCVDPNHKPPLPSKEITLFVGVDIGTKRDRSAVVTVYREGDVLKLGPKKFWEPSAEEPIDLEETVEAFILDLSRQYQIAIVRYDPYQFHRSAFTLVKKGINMSEYAQTTSNLQIMGQNIYDLIEYKQLVLYEEPNLRFEANCARAKEAMRGLQITKEKSTQKIDQIVALAMACVDVTSGFFEGCDLSPVTGVRKIK